MPRRKKSETEGEHTNGSNERQGFDKSQVKSFVERIESLHADIATEMAEALNRCKAIHGDIKLVYDEAKDTAGIPKKALKRVVKARSLERKAAEVREELEGDDQHSFDQIRLALGDLADLPLGQAALAEAGEDLRPRHMRNDEASQQQH